jgi:hypothetical protein
VRRREEDEHGEILFNRVKPVLDAGAHVEDRSRPNRALFTRRSERRSAADDDVDLVLGMRRLEIYPAHRKRVDLGAQGWHPQELHERLTRNGLPLEQLRYLKGRQGRHGFFAKRTSD